MAIVKFISDQHCQIFIDKEYAGKVTTVSLLKVTLEVGSYLIEVKDDEGRILKKYSLEIRTTDNQVLQDVSGASPSTDEVLNLLRNDPTLVFHCDRAKFCLDGKYGYVNKKFEVVIPAIYTIANDFVNNKAFVVRDFPEGRKTTMIDENGNIFFNRWFDYIGEGDSNIVLGIDNRIIIYSKTKFEKIAEYYNGGYDHEDDYVPVFKIDGKDTFYGFIDSSGNITVPLIFSRVSNFKVCNNINQAQVELFDIKLCLLKQWFVGLERIISEKDVLSLINFDLYSVYSNNEYSWNVHPSFENNKQAIIIEINSEWDNSVHKEIIEEADRILHINRGYAVCRYQDKSKVIVSDIENVDVLRYLFEADDVVPVFREIYYNAATQLYPCAFIINNDDYYGIVDSKNNQVVPCEYEIIDTYPSKDGEVYAVLRKDGKSALCDILNKTMLTKLTYDNISLYESGAEMTFLLEKRGKYGLVKDTKLIPANYDKIIVGNHYYIIVCRNKYGIIDDNNIVIMPTEYQEISILADKYIIVKNKNGYSLGCATDSRIYKGIFDRICLLENDYDSNSILDFVLVEKNGKQGCVSLSNGKVKIPIEYDRIELVSVDRHYPEIKSVCFLLYKDGKIGYCEFGYYYIQTNFDYILGSSYKGPIEYSYFVEPNFEECILLTNEYGVLNNYCMHYAAVRKGNKWGILDQKPRDITYQAINLNLESEHMPNYEDLDFKYVSIEDLKTDADNEFKRRYNKYYHPWTIRRDSYGEDFVLKK